MPTFTATLSKNNSVEDWRHGSTEGWTDQPRLPLGPWCIEKNLWLQFIGYEVPSLEVLKP